MDASGQTWAPAPRAGDGSVGMRSGRPTTAEAAPGPRCTGDSPHGQRASRPRPAVAALTVMVAGWLLLSVVLVGLGLALTAWVFDGPVGQWDVHVARWFEDQRTPLTDSLSAWGSRLADTLVVIGLTAVAAGVLLVRRRWPDAIVVVVAPTVEVTAFLVATFVVDRDRPPVARLDSAPPTSSFPSGHVAAAVAIYAALALVVGWRARRGWVRLAVWLLAAVVPACVAWSRLHRGMHHPTDVIVGYAAGLVCAYVAVLAARAARAQAPRPWSRPSLSLEVLS